MEYTTPSLITEYQALLRIPGDLLEPTPIVRRCLNAAMRDLHLLYSPLMHHTGIQEEPDLPTQNSPGFRWVTVSRSKGEQWERCGDRNLTAYADLRVGRMYTLISLISKWEILQIEAIIRKGARAIFGFEAHSAYAGAKLLGACNSRIKEGHDTHPIKIGWTPWYGGIETMIDYLKPRGWGNVTWYMADTSGHDLGVRAFHWDCVCELRKWWCPRSLWKGIDTWYKVMRGDPENREVVLTDGTVWDISGINVSGQPFTGEDNSIIAFLYHVASYYHQAYDAGFDFDGVDAKSISFLQHGKMANGGDDFLMTLRDCPWFSFDKHAEYLLRDHGMKLKEQVVQDDPEGLSFYGCVFRRIQTSAGVRWGFYMDRDKIYNHACRPEKSHEKISEKITRLSSLLPLIWYHPRGCDALRTYVADLCVRHPSISMRPPGDRGYSLYEFEIHPAEANDRSMEHLMFGIQ